jgi:hypothetical protein
MGMIDVHHDAERFLSALAYDGQLTFQTFDDAGRGNKRLSRVMHGTFPSMAATLQELNAQGAGCFVMVNRGDQKGRRTANVRGIRALFVDLDGSPLEPVIGAPISPPIVCESSPGKFHAYWPIEGMPLAAFSGAQRMLADMYGGDPKVCDLPRVMRIPGFLHLKGEPFRSRLIRWEIVKPWRWSDFSIAMGLSGNALASVERIEEGNRNDTLYVFACGLRQQGLTIESGLQRLIAANKSQCHPALELDEVERIARSAWKSKLTGFVKLDHHLIDDPIYRRLSADAKQVLTALARRHNGNNNGALTFTCDDARSWGISKPRRRKALRELESCGFIEYMQRAIPGGDGHRALPDLFRLHLLDGIGSILNPIPDTQ